MQSFLQYRRFGHHLERQLQQKGVRDVVGDPTEPSQPVPPEGEGEPELKELEEGPRLSTSRSSTSSESPLPHAIDANSVRTTTTRASLGASLGIALTGINARTRTSKEGGPEAGKVFVVGYHGENDPLNPHNWSHGKRIAATTLIAWIGYIVGFASSIDSAALPQASEEYGVSDVTESLATGLFLVGFGFGALFSGPMSETIGRNPVYIGTLFFYMIWIMASGLAPNIGAQLVFRLFAGFCGATPLVTAGGSLSDLWDPMERVIAFPVFASFAFWGPVSFLFTFIPSLQVSRAFANLTGPPGPEQVMGPVVGGFIGESSLISWRWVEWITLIWSGLILGLLILFAPETYGPVLLKWKAAHLRRLTGDERYRAEIEVREMAFLRRVLHSLYRPFLIFAKEPIVILWSLYLTVAYIVLFTFLTGYTFIFTDTFGFSQGLTGLSFLGIAIGFLFTFSLVPFIYRWARTDLAKLKAAGGDRLPPENALRFAMIGAPGLPISLFWMGWTAYSSISPWSALVASVVFGFSILCIFISTYQYIISSFEMYAASALASVTLIRYVAAGAMVEVSLPMYRNLNVHWTLTVLGCISLPLTPAPYLFNRYGPVIRSYSKLAKS